MNNYKVVILPLAREDTKLAIDYYNKIYPSLGKRFRSEVKSQIEKLRRWPKSGGSRYDNVRFCNLKTFPYALHYFIAEESQTVYITGVFSHYLNPSKGPERNSE